jgi:two-component system cell cycle response regulator DivK
MPKTILIVEDNALNMKLFNDLLQSYGYEVMQLTDGLEVLKVTQQHRPDLIVLDIQLPGRSGLEIIKDLKADEDLKHIPIVAVTAFAMKGDEEDIRAAGCDDYVSKPISIPLFLETVAKHFP